MKMINFDHLYEIGAAVIVLYLIWIIAYSPYSSMIDNFAIIVN